MTTLSSPQTNKAAMKINIRQTGGTDEWRHERLRQAALFYAHRLMSRERCAGLTIHINIVAGAANFGAASTRANVRAINYKQGEELPTEFIIRVRRDDPWSWTVEWLGHEMVHVMQYASGKLQSKGLRDSWKGGPWQKCRPDDYFDRPWEQEALERQKTLRDEFFAVENTNWVH